jgi:hypothetical protein
MPKYSGDLDDSGDSGESGIQLVQLIRVIQAFQSDFPDFLVFLHILYVIYKFCCCPVVLEAKFLCGYVWCQGQGFLWAYYKYFSRVRLWVIKTSFNTNPSETGEC